MFLTVNNKNIIHFRHQSIFYIKNVYLPKTLNTIMFSYLLNVILRQLINMITFQ